MPDSKLSLLPAGANPVDADLFYSDQSAASVKVTALQLKNYASGGFTPGSVIFAGATGSLAQDNANFFWDDTNLVLKLASELDFQASAIVVKSAGARIFDFNQSFANHVTFNNDVGLNSTVSSYWIANHKSLYTVPNASGDNWFEAAAGNTNVTGSSNFGTGPGALGSLTTGSNNVAVGSNNLTQITDASNHLAFGSLIMQNSIHGNGNIGIGNAIYGSANFNGTNPFNNNVGIGAEIANSSAADIHNNTLIGSNIFQQTTGGVQYNVAIGSQVGQSITGAATHNTLIGNFLGQSLVNFNNCTIVGEWNGPSSVSISNIIGLIDGFAYNNQLKLDWNYLRANVWSMKFLTNAQGLNIYNTYDDAIPTVNYERGVFDWTVSTNILTIGTQAGGTGTVRNVQFVGGTVTFPAASIIENTSTVAGLPIVGTVGRRAFVTDATTTTFASIVAGTGTNKVPVYDDGTNWRIG